MVSACQGSEESEPVVQGKEKEVSETEQRSQSFSWENRSPVLKSSPLLRCLQIVARPLYGVYWRIEAHGCEKVPTEGPVILAANHRSHLDSIILPYVTWRPLNFMAKKECFDTAIGASVYSRLGVFPVNRGTADKAALRRAVEVVRAGGVLGIYPEGTRCFGPKVETVQRGAAWLAARGDAPIFPVGIGGTEAVLPKGAKFVRPAKVRLVVGDPLDPPKTTKKSELEEFTLLLKERLQEAFDDAGGPRVIRSTRH